MNQDIIGEILQQLYYVDLYFTDSGEIRDNQMKTAKKLLISLKKYKPLESIKFDKPIVFSILPNVDTKKYIDDAAIVFRKGGSIYIRTYDKMHLVRVYNFVYLVMSQKLMDMYSLGDMVDATGLFAYLTELNRNIGRNLDTSSVTNMSHMFIGCRLLNKNVGKNWDTSSVTNMYSMFRFCRNMNKNIGKNWDVSKVTYMTDMFYGCTKLRKKSRKKLENFFRNQYRGYVLWLRKI